MSSFKTGFLTIQVDPHPSQCTIQEVHQTNQTGCALDQADMKSCCISERKKKNWSSPTLFKRKSLRLSQLCFSSPAWKVQSRGPSGSRPFFPSHTCSRLLRLWTPGLTPPAHSRVWLPPSSSWFLISACSSWSHTDANHWRGHTVGQGLLQDRKRQKEQTCPYMSKHGFSILVETKMWN